VIEFKMLKIVDLSMQKYRAAVNSGMFSETLLVKAHISSSSTIESATHSCIS
jgi:hypothetical protein